MKSLLRQSITLITLLLLLTLLQSQQAIEPANSGVLGEVRYSVLPIDKFKMLNGDGWELMMGQQITDVDFKKLTGLTSLPDARGVFIRGMNAGRTEGGDPDGDKRKIGEYQVDAVGRHKHSLEDFTFSEFGGKAMGSHSTDEDNAPKSPYVHDTDLTKIDTEQGTQVSIETRPRNICLFVYVKIR